MRSLTAPALTCALVAFAALPACTTSPSSGTTTATATASTPAPPATASPSLGRGDKAPDFSLEGSDGKTHTLAEHAGKEVVVVAWFPKAFTGGCTAECKSLHENGKELSAYAVAVYAASVNPPEINKKFAESLELDYPILSDPTRAVARAYGVLGERGFADRWTFIIGKDGKILDVMKDVSPKQHGKDLAAKLGALGVARR